MKEAEAYTALAIEKIIEYGPGLVLALFTLIIGWLLIRPIIGFLRKALEKRNVDPSLIPFLCSLLGIVLKAMLLISVASMVGVQTASFITVLGAASLAVGLALQGSLSNFAGGVLILFFRPFKVGDVIEAQGFLGIVHEIQIFVTILKTFDNKRILVPNGPLSNGAITNYTAEDIRRVDMEFGISYGDDIDKAKSLMWDLIKADERVLQEPAEPFLALKSLGDSSVNFVMRLWCKAENYWPIYFDMQENLKKSFDKNGVSIPFPQRDVHLYQHTK